MRTYTELVDDAAVLAQRSGDTSYKAYIKVWMRFEHQRLSELYDFWNELEGIHNFDTVADQEDYPLPNRFDKPFRLYDLTDKKEIEPETELEYFDNNVSNIADAESGDPEKYRIYGKTGTRVAISTSGDTVKVKSSSGSDNTGITVRIRGYIDSAHLIEEFEDIDISTSSPTTAVAGTKTFYKITHVSKSANTTGYITITNSSDATLETLAPIERIARHKVLKLGLIPDSVNSMRLLFKEIVRPLIDDNDYPFVECDKFLVFSSAAAALEQDKEGARAGSFLKQAENALAAILSNQGGKMGTAYQHKIINTWLKNFRH